MIPKTVKVGALVYKVLEIDGQDIDGDCGEMSNRTQEIKINNSLSKEGKQVTLLHEILHCINRDLSERDVEFLSLALFQVLKENVIFK